MHYQDLALLGALLVLFALSLAFAIAAVASPITRIRRERDMAARLAGRRATQVAELMELIARAEEIAGLGLWQFDPGVGHQKWSRGLKYLFGLEKDEILEAGDEETMLKANGIDLVNQVMARKGEDGPFTIEFGLQLFDGSHRDLRMQTSIMRAADGSIRFAFGVVIDVTDAARREKHLKQSREKALMEAKHARELAETDPLTGLANRRRVMGRLDRLVMNAHNSKEPLAMIVFDIDHFKRVNDTYGHPEGDKVLSKIAEIALEQARKSDVIGRIGGEEFAWIVPGADKGFGQLVADRLRLVIAVDGATGKVPAITVSMGIAAIEPGDTALSLFARADAALYEAKHAGRNTVKLAA